MNMSSDKNYIVISGNNIDTLKNYPDNYFDSVVTDPPYGLGKEPNAEEMLRAWIDTGYLEVSGSGFMGKEWDAFVPQPLFWKEIFRVLKYGGHIVSFFGTRTYDWGCMAIRLAGFEIRDCIQWVYGSGFPKSHNVGKSVDKIQGNEREIIGTSKANGIKAITKSRVEQGYRKNLTIANSRDERTLDKGNSEWEGWGSALKPANEPIVLARKPLEKGLSIAENVLKWGTGAINIDASRIGNELIKGQKAGQGFNNVKGFGVNTKIGDESAKEYISEDSNGRFPANFIMTHHPDCKCIGIKKVGSGKEGGYNYEGNVYNVEGFVPNNSPTANSNYGQEIIEDWNCHDDCPIKILDEQSGIDSGGASRFFYIAKANKWERNYGLQEFEQKQTIVGGGLTAPLREDGSLETSSTGGKFGSIKALRSNIHPTVKPIKLMQYLVRLITPPNGIVLDPFAGSGTTGIACKIDGFNFVGLELSEDYTKIANARIESFQEENVFVDETIIYKNRNKEEDDNEINQLSLF